MKTNDLNANYRMAVRIVDALGVLDMMRPKFINIIADELSKDEPSSVIPDHPPMMTDEDLQKYANADRSKINVSFDRADTFASFAKYAADMEKVDRSKIKVSFEMPSDIRALATRIVETIAQFNGVTISQAYAIDLVVDDLKRAGPVNAGQPGGSYAADTGKVSATPMDDIEKILTEHITADRENGSALASSMGRDAHKWANEFARVVRTRINPDMSQHMNRLITELAVGWFANAIEWNRDDARRGVKTDVETSYLNSMYDRGALMFATYLTTLPDPIKAGSGETIDAVFQALTHFLDADKVGK